MGSPYKNPPVIEAVCEIRFSPQTPLDITIPGILYVKLREHFPEKQQRIVKKLQITPGRTRGSSDKVETHSTTQVRFLSGDKNISIQFGENSISVSHLAPYTTWENYKHQISKLCDALEGEGSYDIERVGLRYINAITIPESGINLEDYFNYRPHSGPPLPTAIENFSLTTSWMHNEKRDMCRAKLEMRERTAEQLKFVFDIDYFLLVPKSIAFDGIMEWVENAHEKVQNIFENSITDKTKKLWG